MGFLENFDSALRSYVTDSVDLSIVDVTTTGNSINTGDRGGFQARVANRGILKMNDVSLRIEGLNGTLVSTSNAGPWSSSITVNSLSVPAGSLRDTANLHFKAPANPQPAYTTLMNVRVVEWNADLSSILS